MDIINLWKETGHTYKDKINIIKTWLCNGTDGQTYPIHDKVFEVNFDLIDGEKYDLWSCNYEMQFDEILGFKHDYKIDDDIDHLANNILDKLNALTKDIYAHPEKYFELKKTKDKAFCHAIEGINCDYAIGNDDSKCDVCSNHGVKCPFKSDTPNHPLDI